MRDQWTPSRLQRLVQGCFALVCLHIGWRFALYCQWTLAADAPPVARPAGVEGFLPISALLGLRQLLASGQYDPVHPAGLSILLLALATALLLRKGFCGYVCPVGFVSNLLATLGQRFGGGRMAAGWWNAVLRLLKYPLLGFFLFTVGLGMSSQAVQAFLLSEYNLTADVRLLQFFQHPSPTATAVLLGLVVLSLAVRNAWCRWVCPYGALLGLLAWMGPTAVQRDAARCTGCGRCQRACPSGIAVQQMQKVRTPECLGCARCVGACPQPETLQVGVLGRPVPWKALGIGVAVLMVCGWILAQSAGGWESRLPEPMRKAQYARALRGE